MKKRLLSLILVFAMVFGMMPTMAFAGDQMEDTVYISASRDGEYLSLGNGYLAYVPVKLSDLAKIDLETYGLSAYAYDVDRDGAYEITALHLLIYAHEELYGGNWNTDVSCSGGAGSFFVERGLFDWTDCNLQYRHNGVYPLQEGSQSIGATADQIILTDGDFVDVAQFTSWAFYGDTATGFHYFMDGNEEVTHTYNTTANEELTVTLGRAVSAMGGGTDLITVSPDDYIGSDSSALPIYYGTELYADDASAEELNENGQAAITFDTAGTYYLWADGGYGCSDAAGEVVSSPAYAVVTVTAPACTHETWTPATCTTPETCASCGKTKGEVDPEAHKYVDGTCEYCSEPDPDAAVVLPFTATADGETVEVVDMGETEECWGSSAHKLSVTVPAGTESLTITSASTCWIYGDKNDDEATMFNRATSATVTMDAGFVYICFTLEDDTIYHIYIYEAECEHNYIDGTCEYCGKPEIEPTVIVKGGSGWNSLEWPYSGCCINKVAVNNVKVDSVTPNGSNYYITLNSDVADDAIVELGIETNLEYSNLWVLIDGECVNETPMTASTALTHNVQLVDGAASVRIGGSPGYNTGSYIEAYAVNKTFYFSNSGKFSVAPVLSGGSSVTALRAQNETWSADLSALFENLSDSDMTYQVAVDDAEAVDCDAVYTYTCSTVGTHKLVFTAVNDYGTSSAYTATLTVLPEAAVQTVNYAVTGGEIVWFAFTDDKLNALPEGTTYVWDDETTTWTITQPSDINLTGKVMTFYNLVKDDPAAEMPVTTGSNQTAGSTPWYNHIRSQQTDTLSNGTVESLVYLYETTPTGANNNYKTIKFNFERVIPETYFEYKVDGNAELTIVGDVGDVNGHQWTGEREVHVALNSDTPADLVISCLEKSNSVKLANGAGQFTYQTGNWWEAKTWTVKYQVDEFPVLSSENTAVDVEIPCLETYTLDLAPLFADADADDTLTYQVKIGEGDWTDIEGSEYSFTPDAAKEYVLTFRAYDGFVYSTGTYTVNMTATNATVTYAVTVSGPEDVTFYCNAGFDADGKDQLGVEIVTTYADGVYTLSVPENVSRISWRKDEAGMSAPVEEGAALTLTEVTFTIMAGETADTAAALTVKYGDYMAVSKENRYLLLNADDYTYEVTPGSDLYRTYHEEGKTPAADETVIDLVLKHITVIAPAGSTVSSGRFYSYFRYEFNEPQKTTVLEDGRISVDFPVPGQESFIRVQNPEGVTYWDFERYGYSDGTTLEVTADMLFIGSEEFTKETVYADFEKNGLDKADLYLTVNEKGWLDMNTGDTWNLNVFRNFLCLGDEISNTSVALPDMEYQVVSVDGTPSDVVSVTPDANNSSYAEIKAEKAGTAIILVSYDAVYNNDGKDGQQWSAIWPENTGVIMVTVDADDASIKTNMTVNEVANAGGKQVIDAEHDILFYIDETGAEFSFKPEEGCTVSVARSTVGKTMTFNGFATDNITVAEDGTVTVAGLTTGTHIIKVEKNGKAVYQVVRTRQVSYELKREDGTAVTAENPAQLGEKITVQFHDLISPMEKLSGVYNANFGFYYNGEDGAEIRKAGGTVGVYSFSSNERIQTFGATVPADWDQCTYTLTDGSIKLGGFGGSFGSHRTTTYMEGKDVNTSAPGTGGYASVLPDVVIPVYAEGISNALTVTLSGLHDANIKYFRLYTYTDGVKGETDLLEGIERIADGYSYKHEIALEPGDYWVEGVDANDDYNGGIAITVDAEHTTFQIQRYQLYATNSGWVEGTDYTVSVEITDAVGNIRPSSLGQADNYGTMRTSCLYVVGDEVKATFTPIGERADSASAVSVKKKSTYNDYISAKIPQVFLVTITAPAKSTVSAGIFSDYYIYDFVEPTVTEDENGVTAVFRMPEITSSGVQGANHFYRVQNPDGVTYWNFAKWTADTEVTVTAADLYIGDTSFTKDTVIDDYSKNIYDRADIYLNVNHRGYLAMNVGDKHEWNVFRNWMAIESFYNAKVALPDVHYEVINLEGENVLSIEPDENNSSVANMTATGEGTAIVLITYDAMTHAQGQSSTSSKQFSAIWPENTGVVIVTVGEDGTDIDTNMLMDRVNATSTVMDAEHDILFYLGNEGAEFTFTPESGSTVTVNRSEIVNGKMAFGDFTNQGVTTENGVVTLTGLTTGRHIVKVEKDGKANYQVITARQVSYELQDANGNTLTEDAEIRAGDTIKIQFTGLVNPVEKMSGAYNFNARILLEGEDGCVYQSSAGGAYGVYDFSGNPARQSISITLPKYWAEDTYTLNGNIAMSGNANVGLGGHRGFTYAYGFTFREDSPSASLTVSRMPEITLHLAETTFVDGQLVFEDEEGNSIDRTNLTIELTDDINNKIIVAEDGSFPCVAGAYSYVICGAGYRYKTGSFTIHADDVGVTKKIILESSSENAWDGTTLTEPDKDENGVYLIGTGAELAWFAAQQDAGKAAISGKLIADIDLAGYPWDMKTSSSNYATVLDGNDHKIQDLNATVGLFSYLGKDSVIKNLTLYGKVEGTTNAGSIVKYAGGSNVLIENCVNYASVTSTGYNAGGLVGYVYNGATIKNCVNHGAVSGSSSVGGIIGSFSGASVVESCYNTGDITATGNCAGGIFGSTGSAGSIIGCYNTGDVSGANYVGGVGGHLDGPWFGSGTATATDCYSIGIVTGTGSNVGGVMGGQTATSSLIRGYSLADTAADNAIGVVLSKAELKQASLDSSLFGGTCTGYPALLWQIDVTFHKVGETAAETVAPTCLEDGYSLYICSSCGQSTKKDIVNALGHSWCDEGEGAHAHSTEACETCEHCVYTAAVCKVNANCVLTCTREGCEVTKTKDLGGALEHEYCTHTTVEESETCEHCSVTPATCVENGSVIRNCVREGCDNEKAAEVIPFTGHTASGEADDEGFYTCSVCNRTYQELAVLNTSDAPYAWIWDEAQQRFESTNQGKGSTTSTGTLTLTLAEEATVSFRYGVSSENGWDKLTISAATGETNLTIANAISGSSTGTFGQSLAAGTYTLTAAYTKDSGGDRGEDLGWISMITVTYGEAAGSEPEQPATSDWQTVMNKTQTYLTTQAEETAPVVGTFKGEWVVLGLARNGVTADFMDTYYENVKTYVTEYIDSNGRLHAQKSTDNSRVILGLTAIGKDVTDVAGYNLLKGLSDLNYVKNQGVNGPVFALIALDSKDYPTADNATATREALVEYILSKQLTDGGWALAGQTPDDMTPMAIQALAPYYDTNGDVKAAVNKALMVMKTMSATPETYAQMIVALSALGIDCETDERFANVMDNMLSFALENGSFEKGKGSGTNQMSTEQCFYALVAYNRFKNGQTALYDMSDLKDLHTVEILPCENGSVTVSKSSAMTGETITVTVAPDLGYQIGKLTMNDAELTITDNRATFTMPDETAILEATFVKAEASAQAVAQAMTDLEVKDAEEETYDVIADIKKAYSKLTAAEKLEIADEYRAFQNKVKQFETYLKAHIDDAVDELEYFFDDLDEDDYSKQAWKKIEDLYEEALEAVKAARFEEEVYELLEEYLEDLEEAAAGELEVTFRLIGDWKHDDGVSGHDEYVTWIETTEYNMPAGSTIYDLFIKAMDDFDLNQKGASKNYVESIQAPDILGGYWIGEFDNGPNSGWMYTINGDHPGYGLKEQDLEDGDEVIWHYVDDYTLEERKTTSKYYERWLEADDISPETYVKRNLDKIVTIEGKGEVEPELKMSHIGKDVKFSFTPAEGWVIKNIYVDGKDKGAIETYTYKDLAMDARIEVVFAQNVAFQMNFVDVPEAEWFYDDVYFAVSNGLFNGIDEFTFAPGASMTRAMLVTVLYRLEGQPAVYGGSAFADAAAGQWYTDAVIWATRNGIVNGLGNGKFGTNDNVTREQMATILYRYAQNCGYDTTARADLNGYTDAAKISAYAQEAMSWANAEGLVNGRTATTLAPNGTANRAEVAAIFHRFVENIVQ